MPSCPQTALGEGGCLWLVFKQENREAKAKGGASVPKAPRTRERQGREGEGKPGRPAAASAPSTPKQRGLLLTKQPPRAGGEDQPSALARAPAAGEGRGRGHSTTPPRASGRPPDLLGGTVVLPLEGLGQRLQQVLAGREGEVHLHSGVGARLAGLPTEIHDSDAPSQAARAGRGTDCQPAGRHLKPTAAAPPPRGGRSQRDGRWQARKPRALRWPLRGLKQSDRAARRPRS